MRQAIMAILVHPLSGFSAFVLLFFLKVCAKKLNPASFQEF
jgi:hypothetical protein